MQVQVLICADLDSYYFKNVVEASTTAFLKKIDIDRYNIAKVRPSRCVIAPLMPFVSWVMGSSNTNRYGLDTLF
jgi:hypothetical protein